MIVTCTLLILVFLLPFAWLLFLTWIRQTRRELNQSVCLISIKDVYEEEMQSCASRSTVDHDSFPYNEWMKQLRNHLHILHFLILVFFFLFLFASCFQELIIEKREDGHRVWIEFEHIFWYLSSLLHSFFMTLPDSCVYINMYMYVDCLYRLLILIQWWSHTTYMLFFFSLFLSLSLLLEWKILSEAEEKTWSTAIINFY